MYVGPKIPGADEKMHPYLLGKSLETAWQQHDTPPITLAAPHHLYCLTSQPSTGCSTSWQGPEDVETHGPLRGVIARVTLSTSRMTPPTYFSASSQSRRQSKPSHGTCAVGSQSETPTAESL
eukprot:jgi/Botrbrau1/16670/Bobra.0068s0086.1